jgi:MFS family permease
MGSEGTMRPSGMPLVLSEENLNQYLIVARNDNHSTSTTPATPYGSDKCANPETKTDNPTTSTVTGLQWLLICLSLYVSIFVYGLDTTIAADVQGPVVEAFQHVEQLAWLGAGFPLGSVSVILLYGVLYQSFDMKWVYIVSLVLFEGGSALCGAAPNMGALIVGRVIAGAGGSGVFLGCLNYFTALTLPEERGTYITGTGFCWGIGAVLGPVIGGSFVESSLGWRWAFYSRNEEGPPPASAGGLSLRLCSLRPTSLACRLIARARKLDPY